MSTTTAPNALTGTYTVDPTHSRIGFVARHAMVTKVRGSFNEFAGTGYLDLENPSSSRVELTIQTASIDTRNADRDAYLRSNDFFDMDAYPGIRFVSTATARIDADHYRVTGDLTIKASTKPVTVDFEYTGAAVDPYGNQRVGFEGTTTINRKDRASAGTLRWKRAACSSARRSSSSSRCPRSGAPTPPDRGASGGAGGQPLAGSRQGLDDGGGGVSSVGRRSAVLPMMSVATGPGQSTLTPIIRLGDAGVVEQQADRSLRWRNPSASIPPRVPNTTRATWGSGCS